MLDASRKRVIIIVAILAAMLLVPSVLDFLRPPVTIRSSADHRTNKTTNYQKEPNYAVATISFVEDAIVAHEKLLIVLFTFAIAAFTGTLYGVTNGLLNASMKQQSDMSESLRIAQESATAAASMVTNARAFVFIKDIRPSDLNMGDVFTVRVRWENLGQTPARRMINFVNWDKFNGLSGIPDNFEFPDSGDTSRVTSAVLPPRSRVTASDVNIPKHVLDETISKSCRIYVWGWCEYSDIFSGTPRHRTEFCHEIVAYAFSDAGTTRFRLRLHKNYNGADQDCLKTTST